MNARSPSTADATRSSLLLRLRQDGPGRELAWEEFYDLYSPIISGFARRVGARPEQTEDLVQEVLRAFFSVSPEFSYDPALGRFRGYLKTCVWHKMSEMRRKQGREKDALSRLPAHDDASVEAAWDDAWETEKLQRALAAVRRRYSTNAARQRTFLAFEMCALLDRPTERVASELKMSLADVRAAKSRVSKALRQEFDALDDTTG